MYNLGFTAQIGPVYIGERCPAHFCGRTISVDMIIIGTGSVLAYDFKSACQHIPHGCRYVVSLGAWLSILLGLFLLTCPETPRQLMYHNKWERCIEVIHQAYSDVTEEQVTDGMLAVATDVAHDKALEAQTTATRSLKAFFFVPANLRSAITTCGMMLFQRMCGFNIFIYYSSTPFPIVGFSDSSLLEQSLLGSNGFLPFSPSSLSIASAAASYYFGGYGECQYVSFAAVVVNYVPLDTRTLQLTNDGFGRPAYIISVTKI